MIINIIKMFKKTLYIEFYIVKLVFDCVFRNTLYIISEKLKKFFLFLFAIFILYTVLRLSKPNYYFRNIFFVYFK
ncbi:hypothetical protein HERIO_341 [Hepatospora eriocheir]|uniref:Uncharacterized protein n=1 Tax=Hepatospora eriocheir TaxID=1081669 RepID=A0A1X0QDH1_9MICR|nr:hypothetical protein HERIO_341 [Hepatospora eriocheir]